jgi:uncharacterized protein YegJ (DUF2314 family)
MRQLGVLLAALFLWSCSPSDGNTLKREGQPDMVYVPAADAAMNGAIEKARSSLLGFRAALASPPSGSSGFAVKVGFPYGNDASHEHIWLTEVEFSGDQVSGVVNNEPVDATQVRLGQKVTAPISAVSDWMYVDNGVLKGGFTVRVLLDRMSPTERDKTLSGMGARLE